MESRRLEEAGLEPSEKGVLSPWAGLQEFRGGPRTLIHMEHWKIKQPSDPSPGKYLPQGWLCQGSELTATSHPPLRLTT